VDSDVSDRVTSNTLHSRYLCTVQFRLVAGFVYSYPWIWYTHATSSFAHSMEQINSWEARSSCNPQAKRVPSPEGTNTLEFPRRNLWRIFGHSKEWHKEGGKDITKSFMICGLPTKWQARYGNYIEDQTSHVARTVGKKIGRQELRGNSWKKKTRGLGVIRRIRGYTIKMNLA